MYAYQVKIQKNAAVVYFEVWTERSHGETEENYTDLRTTSKHFEIRRGRLWAHVQSFTTTAPPSVMNVTDGL